MSTPRDIRRCAVQALYQFDAGSADAHEIVKASLDDSPGDEETHTRGFDLARRAWETRQLADAAVAALTPEWPTHRQPALDRTILRLAYYEISSGKTPPKVAMSDSGTWPRVSLMRNERPLGNSQMYFSVSGEM